MTTKAFLARLLHGASASSVIVPAVPVTLPTFAGGAYDGNTVTASHGTWDQAVLQYESGWFITDFPFTNLTQISGESGLTYTYQTADVGKKVCYGERVRTLQGGWSQWAYSVLSGIVSATPVASPPVIVSGAGVSPTSGIQVGSNLTIDAPNITGATDWWVSIERDGSGSEPICDFSDVYPLTYTVQPGDICTSFKLVTFASNGAGTVNNSATTPDIGPVTAAAGSTIIDLGSPQATEDFIRNMLATGNWTETGAATQSRTVNSPDALVAMWNSEILAAPMSERWMITLDWDGLLIGGGAETAIDSAGNNVYLMLFGPMGTASWKDAGGWVHVKSASGKQAGFANQVACANARGITFEGIDFGGIRNNLPGLKSGQAGGTAQGCLKLGGFANYPGECIVRLYNCRVGRYANNLTYNFDETINGVWTDGTCEQLNIEKVAFAGTFCAMKIPGRRVSVINVDVSMHCEDIIKTYLNSKSGYLAVYLIQYCTFRDMIDDVRTEAMHSDVVQHGSKYETHLGHFVAMLDCYAVLDHKYANSGTGGTQGFLVGNYAGHSNNLHCIRRSGLFGSAPNAMSLVSPDGIYCSYLERTTLGRCGITPSRFGTDTNNKDWTPGTAFGVGSTTRSGIQFKVNDCIIGKAVNSNRVQNNNTVIVNWTATMTGIIPEAVFNGADFERGGALTANSIANKHGYLQDQTNQQAWLDWFIANLVPQGAYANQGAPAPVKANYSAPAIG